MNNRAAFSVDLAADGFLNLNVSTAIRNFSAAR
jgi:hypothetical protein